MAKKRSSAGRIIGNTLTLLTIGFCSAVFTFAVLNILDWYRDNRATNDVITSIQDSVKITENNKDAEIIGNDVDKSNIYWDFIKMNMLEVDFSELKRRNSDIVGWIQIPDTNINYPFVQTKDNDYYLHRSFDKKKNSAGWVFLDYRNNIADLDQNTIIYAHGRYDMTMFGSLRRMLESGWTNNPQNHVVRISTETENTLWQVFSVYHLPTTTDYLYTNFQSDRNYENFLKMITSRSAHNFNATAAAKDHILTLSTCYNKQERMVLHAKLIKRQLR